MPNRDPDRDPDRDAGPDANDDIRDGWQRLDKWLWCARFLKHRADCSRLVRDGLVRINRQPTDKPHARLRPGDVLTLPLRGDVAVVRVLALAPRRGPPAEARALYRPHDDVATGLHGAANDCISAQPTGPSGPGGGTRSTG